ncbi:MAG: hypothetical protein A2046_08270 [Bacteroidetes bacterium GWA2_30_7]|nr:MAG: hypothetical protein A2046_08270 [Bacteroidetes bacterium GWA2_30_7]
MKLLLLISLIFTICSCKIPYKTIESNSDTKFYPIYFISETTSLLYKAKVETFGKYYSGLLFIKPSSSDTVRIIFMSEIGLKFFDFEINGNDNKINYCFESMNKEYIANTLVNDLRLMLLKIVAKKIKYYQTSNSDITIVKYIKPKRTLCAFQKLDDVIVELKHRNSIAKSVKIMYSDYDNKIPKKIKILHKYIKLSIELNLLEKK